VHWDNDHAVPSSAKIQPLPVVLIGFMGTGKTTVGRLLAGRLGRRFLDLDQVIVQDAGRPISDIFRDQGEAAFRLLESAALGRVLGEDAVVIATGGGAACREDNLSAMLARAHVVALFASPDESVRRAGAHSGRPLFDNAADPVAAARALLAGREPFYRRAHVHVDTEGRGPEEIVAEIIAALSKERELS
jgi:shikimate kinase